jgi:TonB family protein
MTLETGKEWSPESASLLLHAVMTLETRMRNGGITSVIAYVDSVFAVIDNRPKVKSEFAWLDTIDLADAKAFNRILSAVFGVSPEMASTLVSFIDRGPRSTKDTSANIGKMVREILSKKAPLPLAVSHTDAVAPEQEREKSRKALLALKYRPQQSIRDSIARHLPDLEVIYKKQLKLNEMSGGLVWVVFRVDAEGRVLSAKIKSSAIANRQFQQLLEEYVRTIHFKAIPKDMEPMIFEFPFEFKSEG